MMILYSYVYITSVDEPSLFCAGVFSQCWVRKAPPLLCVPHQVVVLLGTACGLPV